jgi:hypothetical protein
MLTGVILNKVSINSMKIDEIPEKSEQIAAKIKIIMNKNSPVLGLFNDTPGFRMLIRFRLLSSFHHLKAHNSSLTLRHFISKGPKCIRSHGHLS